MRSKVNSTIVYKLGLTKFSRMLRPSVRDFFIKIDIKRRKNGRTFSKTKECRTSDIVPSIRLTVGRSLFPPAHHKVSRSLKKRGNALIWRELTLPLRTSGYLEELMLIYVQHNYKPNYKNISSTLMEATKMKLRQNSESYSIWIHKQSPLTWHVLFSAWHYHRF